MFSNELWQKSGVSTYSIDQSIRFNAGDSTYMQRTHGAGGNTDAWTVSLWTKKGDHPPSAPQIVFASGSSSSSTFDLYFENNIADQLAIQDYSGAYNVQLKTTQLFRDPSAWYHIVYVYDSGNAVSTERARLYVNGVRVTDFTTATYPAQNTDSIVGTNVNIGFGKLAYSASNYYNGYLAEMHYVNGSALDPSSFGEYNSSNIWIPKEYSGSYGTGGFYIKGEDSSDLGNDSSGNGNDLTTSGLGAHDQVLDSPTNNFPTLNPISSDGLASGELTGGNLEMRNITEITASMPFPTSGKWYWELCTVSKTQSNWNYGAHYFKDVADRLAYSSFTDYIYTNFYHGSNFGSSSNWTDGDFWSNSNAAAAGDVFGFAWDSDNKKIWLAKNNTYYGSGDPAGNSGTPLGSGGTAGVEYVVSMYSTLSQVMTLNFGQDDTFNNAKTSGSAGAADGNGVGKFYYAPPTGFLALCTKNKGS